MADAARRLSKSAPTSRPQSPKAAAGGEGAHEELDTSGSISAPAYLQRRHRAKGPDGGPCPLANPIDIEAQALTHARLLKRLRLHGGITRRWWDSK